MSGFLIGAIAGFSAGAVLLVASYVIAWRYTKSRLASAVILNAARIQLGIGVLAVVALVGAITYVAAYIGFPADDPVLVIAGTVFLVALLLGYAVVTLMTRHIRSRLPH